VISYADLKQSFSRIAILGDPGGGKSTLCQSICFDLAKQVTAALISETKPSAQLQKFPLRIILRNYEKARLVEPQLSILEYVSRDILNHVTLEKEEIRECLSYLLSSGSAVIAFDGLDEILATAQRREFVDLVVSFCDQYPLCPALVTSRLVGYDDARLTEDFEELVLEKFDDKEIASYSTKFFKIVGGRDTQEAAKLSKKFVDQTSENAADLRGNPLMLGLMAWLFNARGDVPTNRPEIYSECAVLMFERWDPDRGIRPEISVHFDKLQLFTTLASKIFGTPELSAGVERSWLNQEIRSYLITLYDNPARALSGAQSLVDFITGRAWVMTDVGDGVYAFTHQTFLEYFFARHVNETTDTVRQTLDAILPRVLQREWDVVSHLSLQMKTYRSLRRENEALDELTKELAVSKSDAVALFSARALEYLVGSETSVRNLVTSIYQYVTEFPQLDDSPAILRHCLNCSAERRDFVSDFIFQAIVESFKADQNIEFFSLILANNSFESDRRIPKALSDRIVSALRPFVMERAESNPQMARVAWSWFGLVNRSILSKYGLWNFYDAEIRNGMAYIDGLSGICLAASEEYSVRFKNTAFVKKRARDILALIGNYGFATLPKMNLQNLRDSGPPASVWDTMLDDLEKNAIAQVGALLCFIVATSAPERRPDPDVSANDRVMLVSRMLRKPAIQKLSIFSALEETLSQMHLTESGNVLPPNMDVI
jgi:hypothetical protein